MFRPIDDGDSDGDDFGLFIPVAPRPLDAQGFWLNSPEMQKLLNSKDYKSKSWGEQHSFKKSAWEAIEKDLERKLEFEALAKRDRIRYDSERLRYSVGNSRNYSSPVPLELLTLLLRSKLGFHGGYFTMRSASRRSDSFSTRESCVLLSFPELVLSTSSISSKKSPRRVLVLIDRVCLFESRNTGMCSCCGHHTSNDFAMQRVSFVDPSTLMLAPVVSYAFETNQEYDETDLTSYSCSIGKENALYLERLAFGLNANNGQLGQLIYELVSLSKSGGRSTWNGDESFDMMAWLEMFHREGDSGGDPFYFYDDSGEFYEFSVRKS